MSATKNIFEQYNALSSESQTNVISSIRGSVEKDIRDCQDEIKNVKKKYDDYIEELKRTGREKEIPSAQKRMNRDIAEIQSDLDDAIKFRDGFVNKNIDFLKETNEEDLLRSHMNHLFPNEEQKPSNKETATRSEGPQEKLTQQQSEHPQKQNGAEKPEHKNPAPQKSNRIITNEVIKDVFEDLKKKSGYEDVTLNFHNPSKSFHFFASQNNGKYSINALSGMYATVGIEYLRMTNDPVYTSAQKIFGKNPSNKQVLEFIMGHEFGHIDHFKKGITFDDANGNSSVLNDRKAYKETGQEKWADNYAEKLLKGTDRKNLSQTLQNERDSLAELKAQRNQVEKVLKQQNLPQEQIEQFLKNFDGKIESLSQNINNIEKEIEDLKTVSQQTNEEITKGQGQNDTLNAHDKNKKQKGKSGRKKKRNKGNNKGDNKGDNNPDPQKNPESAPKVTDKNSSEEDHSKKTSSSKTHKTNSEIKSILKNNRKKIAIGGFALGVGRALIDEEDDDLLTTAGKGIKTMAFGSTASFVGEMVLDYLDEKDIQVSDLYKEQTVGEFANEETKAKGKKAVKKQKKQQKEKAMKSISKAGAIGKIGLGLAGVATLLDIKNRVAENMESNKIKKKQEKALREKEEKQKQKNKERSYEYLDMGEIALELFDNRTGHHKMGNAKFM